VLENALDLGFDAVATGHYAILREGANGERELHRASDAAKDQSYVLGVLTAEQLAHTLFPLGDTPSKSLVRAEAEARGLAVAHKPDSHDICFVADGDTAAFLRRELGDAPGPIVEQDGTVVGEHDGAYAYTVGQRRGLRIGHPAADGKPRYVLDVSPVERRVTVGPAEALAVGEIVGILPRWCGAPPVGRIDCLAQYRAHGVPVPACAAVDGDALRVAFGSPQRGVAPGQAVVLYDGTRVIGSATIDRTAPGGMTTFTTLAGTSQGL
jgi:tRNA-specific 2-thiouridylase